MTSLYSPLLWLAAFVCALFPINAFQLEFMAAAVLLLLVWAYDRLSRGLKSGLVVPHQPLLLIMALFWLLIALSVLWSGVPWISVLAVYFMSALPLTFLTLCLHPFSQQEWRVVIGAMTGILTVLALWAMTQFFFFNEFFFGRAKHPLADPNSLAAMFNLVLFCLLGAMTWHTGKRDKILFLVLSLVLFGGIMSTGSRAVFFAFILGMVLSWIFCRDAVRASRRYWQIFMAGSTALFILSLTGPHLKHNMASRVGALIGIGEEVPHDNRLDTWAAAWQVIKTQWLTGTGIGTFYLYYPEFRSKYEVDLISHAHNDPLQFWTEMGLVAPLLFYAFMILAIIATFKRVRIMNKTESPYLQLAFPVIGLAVLIAHSHINLDLYNLSILFLTGLVLAHWYGQLHLQGSLSIINFSRVTQALLALAVAGAMVLYLPMIMSEHFAAKARDAIFAGDLAGYGDNILLADRFGVQKNHTVYLLAVNIPMSLLYQQAGNLTTMEQKLQADQINTNLDEVLALNPRSAAAWYYKGMLAQIIKPAALPENMPPAKESFERALKLDPVHLGARIALIDMAMKNDDLTAAHALVDGGIRFRYMTNTVRDFLAKSMLIATLTHDKELAALVREALQDYNALEENMLARKGKNPLNWVPPKAPDEKTGGFPQGVDSKKE